MAYIWQFDTPLPEGRGCRTEEGCFKAHQFFSTRGRVILGLGVSWDRSQDLPTAYPRRCGRPLPLGKGFLTGFSARNKGHKRPSPLLTLTLARSPVRKPLRGAGGHHFALLAGPLARPSVTRPSSRSQIHRFLTFKFWKMNYFKKSAFFNGNPLFL